MADLDVAGLRELLAKATKRPWTRCALLSVERTVTGGTLSCGENREADNDLIVAVINVLPVILDRLDAQEDPDEWLPFSVRNKVFKAICDPGSVVGDRLRASDGPYEHIDHWRARAAIEAMRRGGLEACPRPPALRRRPIRVGGCEPRSRLDAQASVEIGQIIGAKPSLGGGQPCPITMTTTI